MKRRDVIHKLQAAGFTSVRNKGPHEVFGRGGQRIPVPRHREIKEYLALRILRDAGAE